MRRYVAPPARPARGRHRRHLHARLRHPARHRRSRRSCSCPRTPARRSSSATASCSGSTSRSTCSTGSSPVAARCRATSASRGTPTRPAFKLVLERMPPTIYLTFAGPRRRAPDRAAARASWPRSSATRAWTTSAPTVAVAGQAMPIFWLGIMLIIVFAVRLKAAARLRLRHLAALPDARLLPGRGAGARSRCASCAPASSRS